MSGAFLGLVPLEAGGEETEGFEAPGVQSFDLPPLYEGAPEWLDKYLLMAVVSVIVVLAFWLIMARKNNLVPTKGQFIGETAYFFIRNGIARDMIGHDFRRFLPFLIALFSLIRKRRGAFFAWSVFVFRVMIRSLYSLVQSVLNKTVSAAQAVCYCISSCRDGSVAVTKTGA